MNRRISRIAFVAYASIALFTLISLINVPDYGLAWDEEDEYGIAKSTITALQTGEENTVWQHPVLFNYGAAYPLAHAVMAKGISTITSATSVGYVDTHHVPNVLVGALGVLLVFLCARAMFGERVALFAAIFMMLFPQFIAHMHYNPKDIPQMVFATGTFFFLYQAIDKRKIGYAAAAGVFCGMNIGTIVTSLSSLAIFGIAYMGYLLLQVPLLTREFWKVYVKKELLIWILFAVSTLIIAYVGWPLIWNNPKHALSAVQFFLNHDWAGTVLYAGELYLGSEAPWHYAPVYLFMATPVFTVCAIIASTKTVLKELIRNRRMLTYGLLLAWIAVPIGLSIKPGVADYDGIRHYFIAVPAMMMLAGIGLNAMIEQMPRMFPRRFNWARIALLVVIPLWIIIEIVRIHPYQGVYMNELVRLFIPGHIEQSFDMEYWGVSYREGTAWLNEHAAHNSVICVPFAPHLPPKYPLRPDIRFDCAPGTYQYMMYMNRTPSIMHTPAIAEFTAHADLVFAITRQRSTLLTIYEARK